MLLFKHACVFFSRFLLQSISKPKEGPPENLEEVPRIWEGEGYWRSEILNPVDIMTTFRGTPPIGPMRAAIAPSVVSPYGATATRRCRRSAR